MNISVVMSTYNRANFLGQAIEALLSQETRGLSYELVVVDNNSTDNTKQVIESYARRDPKVKYVFEKRQGVAYGRNAGIEVAQGEYLAFCDDDVIVPPDWVRQMHAALLRYPDADFIGGKVLVRWGAPPPRWLDERMAPLACQDFGDKPFKVSLEFQRCLISANLGVRRRAFERAGLFDPTTQRVGDGIGSTEDYDWELSVWQSGGHGMYVPDVVCSAVVPARRMVKSYHRRWHLGHGKFNAIARRSDYEGGSFRLLDVPAFMYRQVGEVAFQYLGSLMRGNFAEAFHHENLLFFYLGFIRERWKQQLLGRGKELSPASVPAASATPASAPSARSAGAGRS
jgi:glycosyltransferase involved in cell wall biosynthesis